MTEIIWNWIARRLSRPAVARKIIAHAQQYPYKHLGSYMSRWWLIRERSWLPFAIRIQHIKRPDSEHVLHDHPWNFRTIILRGWYIEENVYGGKVLRRPGTTATRRAEEFHRIDDMSEAGVVTMFITYRKRQKWGFMVNTPAGPRKILHTDFESANNRIQ